MKRLRDLSPSQRAELFTKKSFSGYTLITGCDHIWLELEEMFNSKAINELFNIWVKERMTFPITLVN